MSGSAGRPADEEPGSLPDLSGRRRLRVVLPALAETGLALVAASVAIGFLEGPPLRLPDASSVFLVAVTFVAVRYGTRAAVVAALGAFVTYDFLFVEPRFTLAVGDTREWLDLLLLLCAAVVIGRLAAAAAARAADAENRARESATLFRVSRALAEAGSAAEAVPGVLDGLVGPTGMRRLLLTRLTGTREIVVADTAPGVPRPSSRLQATLVRDPGDDQSRWIRSHQPASIARQEATLVETDEVFRVRTEAAGVTLGWLVGLRSRAAHPPDAAETRLLALAADQLGLALRRDSLAAAATEAEVARRSEAAKSALLESVSHDLRTPLSGIRAAAGGLLDVDVPTTPDATRAAATTIDREAERLDRLVRNVLDLGRIEAGALRPRVEVFEAADLVKPIVERAGSLWEGAPIEVVVDGETPLIAVDAAYLDVALSNLLENAARHAPGARVRVAIGPAAAGRAAIAVSDAGPGVPADALARLFEKFYRGPGRSRGSRPGLGVGLSIVRGLVEAMGGTVSAGPSPLGGLEVRLDLPAAPPLAEEGDG